MAAIKLFGEMITVKCPVNGGHNHDHDRATRKTTTTSSPSSSSDQGAVGDQMKKPDMIIPCPRCKSMETKFCYFNNYNANQPRHFCKGCHRYWTAGGALRNVPVGAGLRKSKPPSLSPHELYRVADYGIYDDHGDDWQVVKQGSLQLQHLVGIKRRVGFCGDYDQCC